MNRSVRMMVALCCLVGVGAPLGGCCWWGGRPIEVDYVFSGVSSSEDRDQLGAVRAVLREHAVDEDVREVTPPAAPGAPSDDVRVLRIKLSTPRKIACVDKELLELADDGPAGGRVRLARGVARMRYDGTFVAGRVRFEASGQTAPNAVVFLFVDESGVPTRIPAGADGVWTRTVSAPTGVRYVYGFSESRRSGAREYFRIDTSRPTNPFDIITEREFARFHDVPPRGAIE